MKVRIKKRNCESLSYNNKPKNEQNQNEYKPLKSGWFKIDLQNEWVELISRYEFELFVTLTFKDDIYPWKAEHRFQKWIGAINCILFTWRYKRKGLGIRYVVGIEYQKRGTLHIHALLGAKGLKVLNVELLSKLWETNGQRNKITGILIDRRVNGKAYIVPYDSSKGAKYYITKYIKKGGEVDIFVPRKELEGQVPQAFETAVK